MKITDPLFKRRVLNALGDEISCNILLIIARRPESVLTIISKADIPSSSAYRRISELEEEGLIVLKHTVYTPQGKTIKKYKSVFKEISIKFKNEEIIVDATPNTDIYEKAGMFFDTFKKREEKS